MSIIAEVKCARCDRKYSGFRSRCPYCGARRIGRGKYSEEADNSKGKMLIGILILAVLVVAAGVLLFTAPKDDGYVETPRASNTDESTPPSPVGEGGIISVPGNPVQTDETPDVDGEEPTETPPVYSVESVRITYSNITKTDFTAKIGEKVPLRASIEPIGIEEDIVWTSSNPDVFDVVPNTTGTNATVIGIGRGTATLTVICGDKEATCIVRVTQ